jgi:hypothetical protein
MNHLHRALLSTIVAGFVLAPFSANALHATWHDKRSASGRCVLPFKGDADAVLSSYNFEVSGPHSRAERAAVARIFKHLEHLNGGKFSPLKNYAIKASAWLDILARQRGDGIHIRSGNMETYGIVVHELGHRVGNSTLKSKRTVYQAYNAYVTSRCFTSRYSQVSYSPGSRNEEFAEAFSAYVTAPHLLKGGSYTCQVAYKFFRERLFHGGAASTCFATPAAKPAPKPAAPAASAAKPVAAVKPATPATK